MAGVSPAHANRPAHLSVGQSSLLGTLHPQLSSQLVESLQIGSLVQFTVSSNPGKSPMHMDGSKDRALRRDQALAKVSVEL
jgi:hypothetical protein